MLTDFDASKVQPQQPGAMGGHPPGIFDHQISNTYLKPSNNNQHLMLHVEFTTPAGSVTERFIVDGTSAQAIEIAQKQIAALCHSVNVYRLSYPKNPDGSPVMDQAARELRGAKGRIEIAPQMKDGKDTGYVEVKKYFDVNGNEPGKPAQNQQPQQQQPQGGQPPMQQQPGGGWGGANPAPAQQPQQGNASWGNPPQQQQPPAQQPNGGGWTPGGAAPQKAPWS